MSDTSVGKYGFRTVDTERMGVARQASIFANARIVVGVMGAAMANTLFCKPDTCLVYLTPSGWTEPYYWDLASLRNHQYVVCFGPGIPTSGPAHMTSFRIDEAALPSVLRELNYI